MHELMTARWSPRALDPEAVVGTESLHALLEAARWAPSYGNTQPARFVLGRRADPAYKAILDALVPGNQRWAHRAALLLVGIAVRRNEKGEVPYAEYGLGLAVENLVLQAVDEGLVAHQMAGFDPEAVRTAFAVPEWASPLVAIAVGRPGPVELLPEDKRDRERAPRKRLELGELAFGRSWGEPAL